MLIPIRASGAADANDDDDTPQEWSLLELNGELIPPAVRPPASSSSTGGGSDGSSAPSLRMELGSVRFSSDVSAMLGLGRSVPTSRYRYIDFQHVRVLRILEIGLSTTEQQLSEYLTCTNPSLI